MLKVTTLVIAAAAALGMSTAGAQTSPGGSSSGWSYYTHPDGTTRVYAGGSPVGGFEATPNANTTKFTYNPPASSPPPVVPTSPSAGNYTTIKRMGDGFTLEQRANLPVPGRDMSHPVALQKPIPKAAMAKAFAKTLPILGNALALAELLDAMYPTNPPVWNTTTSQYERTESWTTVDRPYSEWNNAGYNYATQLPSCNSTIYNNHTLRGVICYNWFSVDKMYQIVARVDTAGKNSLVAQGWQHVSNDGAHHRVHSPAWHFSKQSPAGTTTVLDTSTFEQALSGLPTFPPEVDPLLPAIPEQARKDLAQESKGPGVSVIPYTPSGTPSFEPWVSPESISTTSTQASSEIITKTKRTTTTATPVQDGVRYDTTTTTTTETQKLDPVTGLPDGPPTTETTTETTEQTPSKPAEGEDLECGLPGTPPCKIDETGTPGTDEANFDKGEEEIESFKTGLLAKIQAKLDEITHEWTWTFALPTGCSALQFDTQVGPVVQIDMCQWQPMIHDIMSMVWAATGVWAALMIFMRSNG